METSHGLNILTETAIKHEIPVLYWPEKIDSDMLNSF